MNFLDPRLPDRFWSKCIPEPNSGCWLWMGIINDHGYGIQLTLGRERRRVRTHRVAYVALVGEIPAGLEIDHRCRNTACCNPAHLEAVTHAVNMERGLIRARAVAANRAATCCRHGHPFNKGNTYVTRAGRRACRVCARDRQKAADSARADTERSRKRTAYWKRKEQRQ